MGKKAREIVKVDIQELLSDLNSAYADEWIAFFYYTWAAAYIEGPEYPIVASEIEKIAKDEFEHLSELADRISELGGEPERDLEDLQRIANCKKVSFPKDERDIDGVLKALAEAEGCAIDVYNRILLKISACYQKDVRTFHLIEHILAEEIEHEEAFENLLVKRRV
ncbi:MAG: ferritin-like domain-containing protein [Candidatus Bathyarchaeia archaeon]